MNLLKISNYRIVRQTKNKVLNISLSFVLAVSSIMSIMPAVLLSANANAIPIGSAILYVNSFDGIDGPTCQDQANPCKTIGYALTKAVSGDTIKVAPGTYNGDLNISQGVTLEGANYNISGNQKRLSESMINGTVTINSSDVTINGFTISPSSGKDTVTANFNTPYSNDIVSDNIINAPYAGQIGVHLNDNDSTVSNNIINYSNANAIGIETSNNSVDNFSVVSNNFVGLAENAPADITIIGSTPVAHDINISNNSSSSGATLAAIFNTNTATINDNTSINAAPNSAIYIGGNDSNVTVTDNTVHGAGKGIKIDNSYGDGPNSDVTATNNDLSSNAIGAVVTNGAYTGGLPNFSDNWWGNANGPFDIVSTDGSIPASNMDGKGSPAIGAMIYSPWCTDEYCLHDTNHLLAPTNIHMLDNTHNNYAPLPPGPVPTTTNTTQLDLVWNPVPGANHYITTAYLNGVKVGQPGFTGTPNAWVGGGVGFAKYGAGWYTFQVCAYGTGLPTCAWSADYGHDQAKPVVSFAAPTPPNNAVVNGDFIVGYSASDDLELKSVTVALYNNNAPNSWKWITTCYQNTSETTASDSGQCKVHLPSNLAPGSYTLQVGAQDQVGNWSVNSNRTIIVNYSAPSGLKFVKDGTTSVIPNGSAINYHNVTLEWNTINPLGTTGDRYQVLADAPNGATYNQRYTSWFTYALDDHTRYGFFDEQNGLWTYQVRYQNPYTGLWTNYSSPATLTYDSVAPTIYIDNKAPVSYYGAKDYIGVHVHDATSGVKSTYIYQVKNGVRGANPAKVYNVSLPGQPDTYFGLFWLTEGTYQMYSTDYAGNQTASYTFTIDRTAPVINPVTYTNSAGKTQTLTSNSILNGTDTFHVSQTELNPNRIYVEYDELVNSKWQKVAAIPGWAYNSNAVDLKVDTANWPDGTYQIKVSSDDMAWNHAGSWVQFSVDNTAPTVIVNSQTTTNTTPIVTGTINDPKASLSVAVNNISYVATINQSVNNEGAYDWSVNVTNPLTPGTTYTAIATATDEVGNVGTANAQITVNPITQITLSAVSNNLVGVIGKNSSNNTKLSSTNSNSSTNTNSSNNTNGQVLGANTDNTGTNGTSGTNGQVKGAHTNTPNTTLATTNNKQNVKTASNFLGLGWWWLLIIAIIGAILTFGFRRNNSQES